MVWRSVMISRPARLRREHYALAIMQDNTAYVPFEDIAVIVLDHPEITITHPVLSACGEFGIGLYATGPNHQPSGVLLPFLSHTRTCRMLRKQLSMKRPVAKRAWGDIVEQKIRNQAACLRLSGIIGTDRLASLARRIRSGDPDNLEAQAAAFYFTRLFGPDFHRSDDSLWSNSALNYGYAVLRGAIARGLVAHGLHPTVGIFHDSEQNAFNLADDVIEPFRPLVDLFVARNLSKAGDELTVAEKKSLVGLLNVDVRIPQGKTSVLSAIEFTIESLVRTYETGVPELVLPTLIGLGIHRPEQ